MGEALVLALVIGGLLWWAAGMRIKEVALARARAACQRSDGQLLDETVALEAFKLARDTDGRVKVQRNYRFEFTIDGDQRREGRVQMLGSRMLSLHLDFPDHLLHEHPTLH